MFGRVLTKLISDVVLEVEQFQVLASLSSDVVLEDAHEGRLRDAFALTDNIPPNPLK